MTQTIKKLCKICGREFLGGELSQCPDDSSDLLTLAEDTYNLVGRIIDNRYRIDSIIGKGGFSRIYKAYQFSIDRYVALKILNKDLASDTALVRRFLQEAKSIARLKSPNTVAIYDSGANADGLLYIAMELLEGLSLQNMIDNNPLPIAETVIIAGQICNSLFEAHSQGIVHRDLKPSNIVIIQTEGFAHFVKVLDFGIAKILQDEPTRNVRLTKTGSLFGTPEYMSPEQARGERNVDHRSDIYSMGIIIYEMLTGSTPFQGETPLKTLNRHLHEIPKSPREANPDVDIPEALDTLILQCLEKDPLKRPQTTRELKERIIAYAKEPYQTRQITPIEGILTENKIRVIKETPKPSSPNAFAAVPFAETAGAIPYDPTERYPSRDYLKPRPSTGQNFERPRRSVLKKQLITGLIVCLVLIAGGFILSRAFLPSIQVNGLPSALPANLLQGVDFSEGSSQPGSDEKVSVTIASIPRGARVLNKETQKEEGITDFRMLLDKNQARLTLVLKLPGYVDTEIILDPAQKIRKREVILKKAVAYPARRLAPKTRPAENPLPPIKKGPKTGEGKSPIDTLEL